MNNTHPTTYLITGATGFIGQALIHTLAAEQAHVLALVRNPRKAHKLFSHLSNLSVVSDLTAIADTTRIDVIINLAGEPIADKRWSAAQKKRLIDSRVNTTEQIVALYQRLLHKPSVCVSASAIGYYGTSDTAVFTETSQGQSCFTHLLCQQWEQAAHALTELGCRVCITRFGVVMGKQGGALAKMLPAFKLYAGGPIASGQQWMSWVHLHDLIDAIRYLIDHPHLAGVFNITAPHAVHNAQFATALGAALGKPSWLRMPAASVKLLFGEMGDELLIKGQKVFPAALLAAGFNFKHPTIEDALRECVG